VLKRTGSAVGCGHAWTCSKQTGGSCRSAQASGLVPATSRGNILITPDGQVKIPDFGIAKASIRRAGDSDGSDGTPVHLRAEQAWGHDATPSSEVYRAGNLGGTSRFRVRAIHRRRRVDRGEEAHQGAATP